VLIETSTLKKKLVTLKLNIEEIATILIYPKLEERKKDIIH